jgi:hypothetical protein
MRRHTGNQVVPTAIVVPCCFRQPTDPQTRYFFPFDRDPTGGDQSIAQVGAGPAITGAALVSSLARCGSLQKCRCTDGEGQRRGSQEEHEGTSMPGCQRCQLGGWNRAVGRRSYKGEWEKNQLKGKVPADYLLTYLLTAQMIKPKGLNRRTLTEQSTRSQVGRRDANGLRRLGWLFLCSPPLRPRLICSVGGITDGIGHPGLEERERVNLSNISFSSPRIHERARRASYIIKEHRPLPHMAETRNE